MGCYLNFEIHHPVRLRRKHPRIAGSVNSRTKLNRLLTLHSRHRRNPELPVNRAHDIETKVGHLLDNFTRQPDKYLRKQLRFQ